MMTEINDGNVLNLSQNDVRASGFVCILRLTNPKPKTQSQNKTRTTSFSVLSTLSEEEEANDNDPVSCTRRGKEKTLLSSDGTHFVLVV